MKYLNKLGKKNLVYLFLNLILALVIVLAYYYFRPITDLRNSIYLIAIVLASAVILDLAISLVIFRLKRDLVNINNILVSIFLSLFAILAFIFVQGEYTLKVIIATLILSLVLYLLRFKILDIIVIFSLFVVSIILLTGQLALITLVLPILIVLCLENITVRSRLNFVLNRFRKTSNKSNQKEVTHKAQKTITKQPPKKSKSSKKKKK